MLTLVVILYKLCAVLVMVCSISDAYLQFQQGFAVSARHILANTENVPC